MNKTLFKDIPEFVRITILSQTKKYLRHSNNLFFMDEEDFIQELLFFYLATFSKKRKKTDEAYIVTSIKNEAIRLFKARSVESSSLFLYFDEEQFSYNSLKASDDIEKIELDILLKSISLKIPTKYDFLLSMILEGHSIDFISKTKKVAKKTLYKILEELKKM